jgi:hypothetical protein
MILILIALIYLIYKIFKKESKNSSIIFILYIFIILSGTKLFSISILRPEIFVTILIIYGYYIIINDKNIYHKISLFLIYLICIYIHPYAMYFIPAILVLFRKNILIFILLLIASYSSLQLWDLQLFNCSDIQIINFNNNFNINPLDVLRSPINTFNEIINNLSFSRIKDIFIRITINNNYLILSDYLPSFNRSIIFYISNILSVSIFATSVIYSIYYIFLNIIYYKKINNIILYVILIYVGLLIHLILNKTNAFYAVNFWYINFTFFLLIGICKINYEKFLPLYSKNTIIIGFVLFGLLVNLKIAEKSWKHIGPNINLFKNSYYDSIYRNEVRKKFNECCSGIPKYSFAIDDSAYFIVKDLIKFPVPVTYSSIFEKEDEVYKARKTKYIIARCDYLKNKYQLEFIYEIDGGLSKNNICLKKIN